MRQYAWHASSVVDAGKVAIDSAIAEESTLVTVLEIKTQVTHDRTGYATRDAHHIFLT
jgi:hypothetical protein